MNRLEFLKKIKFPKFKRPTRAQMIFWGAALALTLGIFIFMRGFTACWQVTNLPGLPPATCANGSGNGPGNFQVDENGTPIAIDLPPTPGAAPAAALPPAWDGASRINILFLGLDARDLVVNEGPPRSDTMMLFTIDPISKTAGMLSIPRDMWVNIPGFGYSRINTAYPSGEGNQLPGGGPKLAMDTVSQFIGVPVNYYAQVDFGTFADFIDFIGGIDVNVEQNLTLDLTGPGYEQFGKLAANDKVTLIGKNNVNGRYLLIEYPPGSGKGGWILYSTVKADGIDTLPVVKSIQEVPSSGTRVPGVILRAADVRAVPGAPNHVVVTCCGYRHMNGDVALAYARTRHTENGDVDRAKRQQQVIFAIQKKIFDPAVFPGLVLEAPTIYQQFSSGIHTNMNLEDAVKLAILGKDISRDSIKTGVIDTSMVTFDSVTLAGQRADIMKPVMDKIRVLRDEIFTTNGATSPLAQGDVVSLMRAEEARVRIADGTFTPGLDQRAGQFFQSQGMNVVEVGQAGEVYSSTIVIVYGPKLYTIRYLQSIGINSNQIRFSPDPTSTVDIEIRLGSDLAARIP